MIKAVLFDLDGTLLDTVPDIQASVNDMLRRHGYPEIDYAQTCAFVGDGEPDAKVALNAGMCGVSALWGYRTREQLEKAGATRFAADYKDLQKILEKI